LRPSDLRSRLQHIDDRREALRSTLGPILGHADRIVWEVGCGHGHYLTAYAKAHPGEKCVGIDIASDRVARAERKRQRARLEQLHFVRADAEDFLSVAPPGCRFTAVLILFPDPWPKRRHHKNRLMTAGFLSRSAAFAEAGARLYFRTDHEPYFREAEAIVGSHPDWLRADGAWPLEEPTVFERRAPRHFSLVAARR
jgi:tRNA (guanine-N7-)-methyltransferase